MKIKQGLKIVLLICSVSVVGLLMAALYSLVIIEDQKFEYSMLMVYAVVLSGILSIIYHIKTLKYYRTTSTFEAFSGSLFWIGNIVFSIVLFCFSLYMLYSFYLIIDTLRDPVNLDYLLPFGICAFTLLLGVFLALEESALYKYIQNYKEQQFVDSIDDIKGHQKGDFE
ncbi:hypothetical protein [Algibacter sp. 2305UL17-15]|uniref:hypothetical protein n=1 Tax=Algibacter sp. 2305UL17-15 TaxID=3231268 RepID=UPI00345A0B55